MIINYFFGNDRLVLVLVLVLVLDLGNFLIYGS